MSRSLEALVRNYGEAALKLIRGVLHDPGQAEDAWQETWWAIWKHRGRIEADDLPWSFVRTTALRKALDQQRREKSIPHMSFDEAAHGFQVAGLSIPVPGVGAGSIDLSALEPLERAAIVLFFWEGLAVIEIADVLQVPTGTVKTWMFRGRKKLRSAMAKGAQPKEPAP